MTAKRRGWTPASRCWRAMSGSSFELRIGKERTWWRIKVPEVAAAAMLLSLPYLIFPFAYSLCWWVDDATADSLIDR